MKISEMLAITKVAGLQPERAWVHSGLGSKEKAIWRMVDTQERSVLYPVCATDPKPLYKPVTTWYATKISALRAAMCVLENRDG